MFDNKWLKILKTEWESICDELKELRETNAKLEKNQSKFLMDIVKRQSDEIKRLSKFEEQDIALFSYEQSHEAQKLEIAELKVQLKDSQSLTKNYKTAHTMESNMNDLLIERVVSSKKSPCVEYERANILDTRA